MLTLLDASLYTALPYAFITLSFVITFQYIRFPDITCASTFVLGSAVCALSIVDWHWPPYAGLALAATCGAAGGCLTSFFHLVLRIDKLLAGILAAFALYSVNLMILHPTIPYGLSETVLTYWETFDRSITATSRVPLHFASIGFMLFAVLLAKTLLDFFLASELGLCMRALEDEEAGSAVLFRLGLRPRRIKALALVMGNSLVGIGGALVSMAEGAANAHRGFDVLITALIAYLIGARVRDFVAAITERWRNIGAPVRLPLTSVAVLGPVIYYGLINCAYRFDIQPEAVKLIIAVLVALTIGRIHWARAMSVLRTLSLPWSPRAGELADRANRDEKSPTPLTLSHVTYYYTGERTVRALQDVSISIEHDDGTILLSGPNGCGKTTLLRLVAGRLSGPSEGKIVILGRDVTNSAGMRRAKCAYLDQDARRELVATLSVRENLALSNVSTTPSPLRRALSARRKALVSCLCTQNKISLNILDGRIGELSGGQRQLINILSLFARQELPELVLADEPFNNLDEQHVRWCAALLRRLREEGKTLVVSSHAHYDALDPQHMIVMRDGMLQQKVRYAGVDSA